MQPAETLRSLTESKRLLEETRRELADARERAQLSPTHTFSPLPNFFDRPAEIKAIERALKGDPSFTVLFGASSVGKVCRRTARVFTCAQTCLHCRQPYSAKY
jgi:hypothetical protein